MIRIVLLFISMILLSNLIAQDPFTRKGHIGKDIEFLAHEKGLTDTQLSIATGIKLRRLHLIKRGRIYPTIEELEIFCKILSAECYYDYKAFKKRLKEHTVERA
jgi:DNA-binding Xre family transcriptional regulator